MDSFFQNKFCIEPKQILQGDYYFPLPNIYGFDNTYSPEQNAIANGINSEEVQEKQKKIQKSVSKNNMVLYRVRYLRIGGALSARSF